MEASSLKLEQVLALFNEAPEQRIPLEYFLKSLWKILDRDWTSDVHDQRLVAGRAIFVDESTIPDDGKARPLRGSVTRASAELVLRCFGPVDGKKFLRRIEEVCAKGYFHGVMSAAEAEELLLRKPMGTFLIRIAQKSASFSLSVRSAENLVTHTRIRWDVMTLTYQVQSGTQFAQFKSLDEVIEGFSVGLQLRAHISNSKFRHRLLPVKVHQPSTLKSLLVSKVLSNCSLYRRYATDMLRAMPIVIEHERREGGWERWIQAVQKLELNPVEHLIPDPNVRQAWQMVFGDDLIVEMRFFGAFVSIAFGGASEEEYSPLYKLLRHLEDFPPNGSDEMSTLTLLSLAKAMYWFGPYDSQFFHRISEMITSPGFHGAINSQTAEQRLSGKSEGDFLIRLTAQNPGHFSIAVMTSNPQKINHFAIEHSFGGSFTLGRGATARSFGHFKELLQHAGRMIDARHPIDDGSEFSKTQNRAIASSSYEL